MFKTFREKSGGVRLWSIECGTSLGAAEDKTDEESETSDGGHRYQGHVSDGLQ